MSVYRHAMANCSTLLESFLSSTKSEKTHASQIKLQIVSQAMHPNTPRSEFWISRDVYLSFWGPFWSFSLMTGSWRATKFNISTKFPRCKLLLCTQQDDLCYSFNVVVITFYQLCMSLLAIVVWCSKLRVYSLQEDIACLSRAAIMNWNDTFFANVSSHKNQLF